MIFFFLFTYLKIRVRIFEYCFCNSFVSYTVCRNRFFFFAPAYLMIRVFTRFYALLDEASSSWSPSSSCLSLYRYNTVMLMSFCSVFVYFCNDMILRVRSRDFVLRWLEFPVVFLSNFEQYHKNNYTIFSRLFLFFFIREYYIST